VAAYLSVYLLSVSLPTRYSVVQFSKKNSAKYLKYTPKAVAELLKELFLGEVVPTAK
jgi:hypothetical protein